VRLPFGLGRRSSSGNGASTAGSDAPTISRVASATPAPSRAWASLPPIQRTAGDMPLVAAPGSFVNGLPGSHGLPPIVEPLGHEVSNLAAPGLVVARTRSVEAPAAGAIPAPVQRRSARGSRAAVQREAADAEAAPLEATSVMAAAAPAGPAPATTIAAAAEVDTLAEPELPIAPIRTMPTVSRQSIHVPDRPLTSAASAARPAALQRAAAAAAASATGTAPMAMPVSGGMRRVPSGAAPAMPDSLSLKKRPR
jgi:hypothetical protein